MVHNYFWKTPFFTHFGPILVPNGPFPRRFGIFHPPKRVPRGSKLAKNTCFSIPSGLGLLLEERIFDPFLTRFWSQNGPFSRHFAIFHGPNRATTGSKRAKNACLSMPSGLGTTFENSDFFRPRHPGGPTLGPNRARVGCPPAAPSDHWYRGLCVSVGDSEAWKPQKAGGCGRTRCPRNSVLSHGAQDTAHCWFRACLTRIVHIQAILRQFWAVSRTYRGARGQERALGHSAIEAHVECRKRLPWLAVLTEYWVVLGQKRLFWSTKCAVLGGHLPTRRPCPGAPSVSFWLKTWIWQGHHLGSRMARVE